MKKSLIFAIASILMLMISCSEEQPTKVSEYVFDKRNIENDTNWVEFHDYDTIEGLCYDWIEVESGVILNSLDEYKEVYNRATDNKSINVLYKCRSMTDSDFVAPQIDFNKLSLVIYSMRSGDVEFERKIYYNLNTDEYFYLLVINYKRENLLGTFYEEAILFPKISNYDKLKFDTIVNHAVR